MWEVKRRDDHLITVKTIEITFQIPTQFDLIIICRFPIGDVWRNQWIEALEGTQIYYVFLRAVSTGEDILQSCWLCSAHFDADCFDLGSLKQFSIPTKYISDDVITFE